MSDGTSTDKYYVIFLPLLMRDSKKTCRSVDVVNQLSFWVFIIALAMSVAHWFWKIQNRVSIPPWSLFSQRVSDLPFLESLCFSEIAAGYPGLGSFELVILWPPTRVLFMSSWALDFKKVCAFPLYIEPPWFGKQEILLHQTGHFHYLESEGRILKLQIVSTTQYGNCF